MIVEDPSFWRDCELVSSDPEVVHGAPVFKGTRLDTETVIGSVDAYMELQGFSEDAAIEATSRDYPTAPSPEAIRKVLVYFDTRVPQLQA